MQKVKQQHCASSKEVQPNLREINQGERKNKTASRSGHITYIRLDFQVAGNGEAGFKIMPTFAGPISFSGIRASQAPGKVINKCLFSVSILS